MQLRNKYKIRHCNFSKQFSNFYCQGSTQDSYFHYHAFCRRGQASGPAFRYRLTLVDHVPPLYSTLNHNRVQRNRGIVIEILRTIRHFRCLVQICSVCQSASNDTPRKKRVNVIVEVHFRAGNRGPLPKEHGR